MKLFAILSLLFILSYQTLAQDDDKIELSTDLFYGVIQITNTFNSYSSENGANICPNNYINFGGGLSCFNNRPPYYFLFNKIILNNYGSTSFSPNEIAYNYDTQRPLETSFIVLYSKNADVVNFSVEFDTYEFNIVSETDESFDKIGIRRTEDLNILEIDNFTLLPHDYEFGTVYEHVIDVVYIDKPIDESRPKAIGLEIHPPKIFNLLNAPYEWHLKNGEGNITVIKDKKVLNLNEILCFESVTVSNSLCISEEYKVVNDLVVFMKR
ncbi:hypothetical protein EI427_23410 [Flammeovirga pectinis]|uniref:Uncharacterized protein n=1 Tax=Flammeovirga pectinis TaxID=2494373 RepID=A0A3S9PAE1_9BACT|nr:hypothetical protein [Flammeovirga pectinis]AZQ65164.1 hypothetical protein EI427_23410 [Flammeovirga pectinis]